MTAAIRARGLGKAYGRHRALDGIDLDVPAGALALVVGTNGAGKSTLLGCLAGVLRHEGTIEIIGDDGLVRHRAGAVAYLPQRVRLPGPATVGEVLALFTAASRAATGPVAPPEGFLPADDLRIGRLSGGQAQRVALVAVLGGSSDVIILDEPFANLDDDATQAVAGMLREHRAAGTTVVVASPAVGPLLAEADLVVRIEGGRAVPSSR